MHTYLSWVDALQHEIRVTPTFEVNQFSIELKHFNILNKHYSTSNRELSHYHTLCRLQTLCMIIAASRMFRFSFFTTSCTPSLL